MRNDYNMIAKTRDQKNTQTKTFQNLKLKKALEQNLKSVTTIPTFALPKFQTTMPSPCQKDPN